jgi:hypothetical protein
MAHIVPFEKPTFEQEGPKQFPSIIFMRLKTIVSKIPF